MSTVLIQNLWHSIDKILHCSSTSNTDRPAFPNQPAPVFSSFEPVATGEIRNLILSSPKSTGLSDPISPKLLPYCVDVIVPVVTRIINLSLSTGIFPNDLKSAFVKPLLEEAALDSNDSKNYCPIS